MSKREEERAKALERERQAMQDMGVHKQHDLQQCNESSNGAMKDIDPEQLADEAYKAQAAERTKAERAWQKLEAMKAEAAEAQARADQLKAQLAQAAAELAPAAETPAVTVDAAVRGEEIEGEEEGVSSDSSATEARSFASTTKHATTQHANVDESAQYAITHAKQTALALRHETATLLCERIAEGESLAAICKEVGMPAAGTFLRWCKDDGVISAMYTDALRMRSALYADEIISLSDQALRADSGHQVAAIKLMVNSRQWVASRLLPSMYGEKTTVEHTGEVKLSEEQIDQRLNAALSRLKRS